MMVEFPTDRRFLTLYELNNVIKSAVSNTFPDACWVTAEIADLKCNQKGHCYVELVQKEDDRVIAQIKATIWAYEYKVLGRRFEKIAGEPLKPGMMIMLLVEVTFHEVYGLSLNVRDIDPTYTIGEMARKKKEVLERLKKEGIIDLNKGLPFPLAPQRIAVISSPTAAGYEDFFNQLDNNSFGYKFSHVLFPAIMQGQEAESSIISAFGEIKKSAHLFDVVVVIRGGGSATDLSCFDGYQLASLTARFNLPVITGIGHEKDDTVVDVVAHRKMKTPTAVAEFLVSALRNFEDVVIDIHSRTLTFTESFLKDERYKLDALRNRLSLVPLQTTVAGLHGLLIIQRDLQGLARQLLRKEDSGLDAMEQAIRHLSPSNVLRRGYSITRSKGRTIRDALQLKKWAVIETQLHKGTVTSIVRDKKEDEISEQRKADDLLPGLE